MSTINIYLGDLTENKQKEVIETLGDNGNYDVFPIATSRPRTATRMTTVYNARSVAMRRTTAPIAHIRATTTSPTASA